MEDGFDLDLIQIDITLAIKSNLSKILSVIDYLYFLLSKTVENISLLKLNPFYAFLYS